MAYKVIKNPKTKRFTVFKIIKGQRAKIVAGGFKTKAKAQAEARKRGK